MYLHSKVYALLFAQVHFELCIKSKRDSPICDGSVRSQDSPFWFVVNKVELWTFSFGFADSRCLYHYSDVQLVFFCHLEDENRNLKDCSSTET
jgi:hypothetical protein